MKLVSYRREGAAPRSGMLVDGGLVDLAHAGQAIGVELSPDLLAILRQEQSGVDALRAVEAESNRLPRVPLGEVTLGPALVGPPKILLLAANYQSHITESGALPVDKAAITPRFFLKPGSAVIGPGDAIEIPSVSDAVDYEIEIAAVIGRPGKSIPIERAEAHVFGYVLFNDISARNLKVVAGRTERNGDWFFDWLVGKWCDTFGVVGPWLATVDELPDVRGLEMSLRVNGELRQHSSAGEMIFTVPEAIAWISQFVTLEPGDLICMGTPGGVGETTQTYLQPGDEVEATIESLGTSLNPVQRAT